MPNKNDNKKHLFFSVLIVSIVVIILSYLAVFYGYRIVNDSNVPGIRIAALILTFASFLSSTILSLLVYRHYKMVHQINEDTNKRAELARNSQFIASNYSIIEFMDRMLISNESTRYIQKYVLNGSFDFHMAEESIDINDVLQDPDKYQFLSVRIPFRVLEGKLVSKITIKRFRFSRYGKTYIFNNINKKEATRAYILYNEFTKRNNIIINIIIKKEMAFYNHDTINPFTKIVLGLKVYSLLNVVVAGNTELYFSNPEQTEIDGSNNYRINSSNFVIDEEPFIDSF